MEYIVTDYKKSGGGRIELCLNETIKLWLYVKEARQFSIEEGAGLTEEQYQQLLHKVIGTRAVKRAMHLLERQDRTEYQLRTKLLQSAYPEEAIEEAISYVKGYHYLDDERYARNYISCHQKQRSRRRLQADLIKRGVAKNTVEFCLEEEFCSDEREQIAELLKKRQFETDTADEGEFRRMYQFLLRRGFRSSDILSVMRSVREP